MNKSLPNILLIMTDQHRGDCLSLAKHPVVQTPNLDAIAGQGAYFSRCYSTCPSCIPARRSLLSGQFPSTHGMVGFQDNHEWHPPTTLPEELRKAGYQTALIGRTMHQTPRNKGFGFEYQDLVIGSDGKFPTDREIAINQKYPSHGMANAHGINGNGWVSRSWHLDEEFHQVTWTVTQAIKWLARRDPTRPYFLVVSFNPPHPPSTPPEHYFQRYMAMDLPRPTIGDWAVRPANDGLGLHPASHHCVLEGDRAQLASAGYFAAINHIDDQVARITDNMANRTTGMVDNTGTIVLHTADHGEMLGDHYKFRKCWPYEASARVPFLIKGPGIAQGVTHDHPVCLEDIMPTLLDLAGLPIPDSVDGSSLAPILRQESTQPVRPFLHGEHATCYGKDQANHYMTDHTWKYIWYTEDGSEQLFNLKDDPAECRNLAASAEHEAELTKWRQRLIERLTGRPEGFVSEGKLVAGCEYPATMAHVSQPSETGPF